MPRNELGEVVPAALFDSPDLRGLIVPQRSYSTAVDELLAQRASSSGLRNVLATDGGANILRMLKLRRGDYTLEYDFVVNHLLARTPELRGAAHEFTLLPMAGAQPFPVGMACPHAPWGRQMIGRIDAALTRIASQQTYQEALLHWMTPESAKRYNRALTDFMQQRAKPTPQGKYPPWPSVR